MFQVLGKKVLAGLFAGVLISQLCPTAAFADSRADAFRALDSDSADHSCQVILRSASLKRDSNGLPVIETDALGQRWYSFETLVDAAIAPLTTGASVHLLYRASNDSQWHSAPGLAVNGAPQGLQRTLFRISHDTIGADKDPSSLPDSQLHLHLIPYLQASDGRRIFDHNSGLDDFDSVALEASENWTIESDPALCPAAGRGSSTVRFLGNWTLEQRGLAQPGQSLFVEYDLTRLPQCQASSYNGLPAWQTEAMIRFAPSGEEFSASLNSLQNGKMVATPARFEIPSGSSSAQLWFKTRGRNCETSWDSNYGRNYEIQLRADVAPSPAWAGQWRMISGPAQCLALNKWDALPEDSQISDDDLKSCRAVEAEVFVPGLTTTIDPAPEAIQAQVKWSVDGIAQRPQWLTYTGRSGQNYRFRWLLPAEFLRQYSWHKLDYSFQFSTDGLFWLGAGRAQGNHNGIVSPRTLEYRGAP